MASVRLAVLVLAAVVAVPWWASGAQETGPPPAAPEATAPADAGTRRTARALAAELMSPFCPGLTLAVCPSENARALREEIATRLADGETRNVILTDLIGRYGAWISPEPPLTGTGALAWYLPGALGAGLLLALVAAVGLRRRRAASGLSIDDDAQMDPALLRRVDSALDDLD